MRTSGHGRSFLTVPSSTGLHVTIGPRHCVYQRPLGWDMTTHLHSHWWLLTHPMGGAFVSQHGACPHRWPWRPSSGTAAACMSGLQDVPELEVTRGQCGEVHWPTVHPLVWKMPTKKGKEGELPVQNTGDFGCHLKNVVTELAPVWTWICGQRSAAQGDEKPQGREPNTQMVSQPGTKGHRMKVLRVTGLEARVFPGKWCVCPSLGGQHTGQEARQRTCSRNVMLPHQTPTCQEGELYRWFWSPLWRLHGSQEWAVSAMRHSSGTKYITLWFTVRGVLYPHSWCYRIKIRQYSWILLTSFNHSESCEIEWYDC